MKQSNMLDVYLQKEKNNNKKKKNENNTRLCINEKNKERIADANRYKYTEQSCFAERTTDAVR